MMLMCECEANGECRSISIDGTMKPSFVLLGQPAALAPKAVKASHAIPLNEQQYTLITGLGMSGAVLVMKMAFSEASPRIAVALVESLTPSQLDAIQHIAVDDPSVKLWNALKAVFQNLENLSLCIPHLAFVHESANGERRTKGSKFLRQILHKVSCLHGRSTYAATSPVYHGGGQLTRLEAIKVIRIRNQSMRIGIATQIQKDINPNSGFKSRGEYMDSLAALVVLYPKEVRKKATSGRKIKDVLATSCYPNRLEFMFNEARFKRHLSSCELQRFQAGVCGNEAFHREIKSTFDHCAMHPSVLEMKLTHLHTRMLIAHNSALYHPTLRRMEEGEVLARRVPLLLPWPTDKKWNAWCASVAEHVRGLLPARAKRRQLEQKRCAIGRSIKRQ